MPERFLVLLAPDWPAAAAARELDADAHLPLAVFSGNRVVCANAPARSGGVRHGQLRRQAQLAVPELIVAPHDPGRDHRAFAPLLEALETHTADFSVLHPGLVALPLRPLAAFWGSEERAVEAVLSAVTDSTGQELAAGIADALFTAVVAAGSGTRVAPGRDAAFLAPRPVAELVRPEHPPWAERAGLVEVLTQLGLRRLGDFAALPAGSVAGRFGPEGLLAHEQAGGRPEPAWRPHRRQAEFGDETRLESPALRAEELGFAVRAAASRFLEQVASAGLRCTQIRLTAIAEEGERHTGVWRLEPGAGANDIADRLRWQVEAWIAGTSGVSHGTTDGPAPEEDDRPRGITRVLLQAVELIAPLEDQPSLLQRSGEAARVHRSLARVQGLFGAEAVLSPSLQGGRTSHEENLWTPWQQQPVPERDPDQPWEGRLPAPHPVVLLAQPAELLDAAGADVAVTPRQGLRGRPRWLRFADGPGRAQAHEVRAWSGSWPVETGWWDADVALRLARLQVLLADGRGFLLHRDHGAWHLVGRYE